MNRPVLLAALLMTASPALAERTDKVSKAQLPLCEIWASVDAPNWQALIDHEMAHCWGWVHPINRSPLLAKTKAEREAYRAYVPPLRYRMLGAYPNAEIHSLTDKDAARECGSWGCMSGGLFN